MLDAFFCQGVFLSQWCVRSWTYIVAVVVIFVAWKLLVPKGRKL